MNNFYYCQYTYRHRKAFKYVVERIVKDSILKEALIKRAEIHDMDKMVEYLTLPKEVASKNHRNRSAHHIETGIDNKSDLDLYEMIIDFECAGYTKPDKPFNAHDFINILLSKNKINISQYQRFSDLLDSLNINYSYSVTNDLNGMDYVKNLKPTEEDIYQEVIKYSKFDFSSKF